MALVPQRNTLEVAVRLAPNAGIDSRASVGAMPEDSSIYSYNLTPAEFGMLLRPGFREHQTTLTGDEGVRTIIPYTGEVGDSSDDKLFAVTNEGIWDVTIAGALPVQEVVFAITSGDAGHGVTCYYSNDADRNTLFYADGENGLYEYDPTLDTWAPVTDIQSGDGVVPALDLTNVVFVMVHKDRLWLIEKDVNYAWYLPIASESGEATLFSFAGKFPHGGNIYGLYNWSVDGGIGVDDYLVAVSSSGDVLPYKGSDPSTTTGADAWGSKATYYVGTIPRGRRFASEYSGELYLLSSFGLIAMSDLLRGVDSANPAENSLAFKIARPLRRDIEEKIDLLGWEPVFIPPLGQLVITTPKGISQHHLQYVMNLAVEGWGMWRGVPAQCIEDWNGKTYFGTGDGRVCSMDSTLDEVKLIPPAEGINGIAVEFSVLSSYTDLGTGAVHKQVQFTRPNLFSPQAPNYTIKLLYDYEYTEPALRYSAPTGGKSTWDVGLWDQALWSSSLGTSQYSLEGSSGIGRTCAIAMRGASLEELRLFSWDIMWKVGGPI